MKFQVCLRELTKSAGLLDSIKNVALAEVKGTKPWLIGRNPAASAVSSMRPAAQSGLRTAVRGASSGASGSRVYDLSEQARKMGI